MRRILFILRACLIGLIGLLPCQLQGQTSTSAANRSAEQAQSPQRIRLGDPFQSSQNSSRISSVTTFAPASPSDSDIGEQVILREPTTYDAWSIYADSGFFWTSNARLLRQSRESDTFFTSGINVNYLPYLGNNLFLEFGGQFRIYRYIENPELDFNYTQGRAGLVYVIRELGDLAVFVQYQYDLLTSRNFFPNSDGLAETYHDHTLAYGLRKAFIYSRGLSFYASYTGEFVLGGQPGFALTNAQSFLLGTQIGMTRMLDLDVYHRFTIFSYRQNNRIDLNNLLGAGLTFTPFDWLSVQATSSLVFNHSNESFFSYFAANLGGSLTLALKF